MCVRRPRKMEIDQTFTSRQRLKLIAISIANIELLSVVKSDRCKHRSNARSRRRRAGRWRRGSHNLVKWRRRCARLGAPMTDERDEIAIGGPRGSFREDAGQV